jgi:predicted HTH domain antitoxin
MVDVISSDLLEDELKAVMQAGNYGSKEEAIGHALKVLLVANPRLRIDTAVELYRRNRVTLMRATEIAGLEMETFKQQLAEQHVLIAVDEPADEIHVGVNLIHRLCQVS